jgi:competence protein ComEA
LAEPVPGIGIVDNFYFIGGEKMRHKMLVVPVLVVLALCLSGLSAYAGDAAKVNINTATADQLTQLKGVGPSLAAKIVEFREKNGPFKNPADITMVSGIGTKTFENNKDLIVIE